MSHDNYREIKPYSFRPPNPSLRALRSQVPQTGMEEQSGAVPGSRDSALSLSGSDMELLCASRALLVCDSYIAGVQPRQCQGRRLNQPFIKEETKAQGGKLSVDKVKRLL